MQLLRDAPGEIAAELAAVVLRNLASGSAASRQAIVDAAGLWPLLSLLALGQEKLVYPMACQVAHLITECPAACGYSSCALRRCTLSEWHQEPAMQCKCTSAYMHAHCLVISAVSVSLVSKTFDMRPCHNNAISVHGRCNTLWGRNHRNLLSRDNAASTSSRAISALRQRQVRVLLGASCLQGGPSHP